MPLGVTGEKRGIPLGVGIKRGCGKGVPRGNGDGAGGFKGEGVGIVRGRGISVGLGAKGQGVIGFGAGVPSGSVAGVWSAEGRSSGFSIGFSTRSTASTPVPSLFSLLSFLSLGRSLGRTQNFIILGI